MASTGSGLTPWIAGTLLVLVAAPGIAAGSTPRPRVHEESEAAPARPASQTPVRPRLAALLGEKSAERRGLAAEEGEPGEPPGVTTERALALAALPCLKSVLKAAQLGVASGEAAAWIVTPGSAEDPLQCVRWPRSEAAAEASWRGPVPRGLLAQVHSHPTLAVSARRSPPYPSRTDCRVAEQLGVPVLTVSLSGVYECRPADGSVVRLLAAGWGREER